MSETQALTLPLGERFRWISFFVANAGILKSLLGLWNEWQAAGDDWNARAEVIKAAVDLLKGVMASIPTGEAVVSGDVEQLVVAETAALELAIGNQELFDDTLGNLPKLISFVMLLARLFGR